MKKTYIDYIADLWSGRLHNTVTNLFNQLRNLTGRIQTIERNILIMVTQNEQKLTQAAQTVTTTTSQLRTAFDAMMAKMQTLIQQAQAPEPTAEPEDLSQEFVAFDEAISGLEQLGAALASGASSTPSVNSGDVAPPVPTPTDPVSDPANPIVNNPATTDPNTGLPVNPPVFGDTGQGPNAIPAENTSTVTPLAGATGATNTVEGHEVSDGEVFAHQPGPGHDPIEVPDVTGQPSASEVNAEDQSNPSPSLPVEYIDNGDGDDTPNSADTTPQNAPSVIDETITGEGNKDDPVGDW